MFGVSSFEQSSVAKGFVETRLTEASSQPCMYALWFCSLHVYLEAICAHKDVAIIIWVVDANFLLLSQCYTENEIISSQEAEMVQGEQTSVPRPSWVSLPLPLAGRFNLIDFVYLFVGE